MPRAYSLFAVALLTGCTTYQPAAPPAIAMPGAFRIVPTAALAAPLDRWWQGFGDPVLDALIDEALRDNLDIETANARLAVARAGVRFSEAQLGPALVVGGDAAVAQVSREDPALGPATQLPGFERTQDRYAVNVGASWELDLFGRLRARRLAAEADYGAAEAALAAIRLAIASELTARYATVRMLEQRQRVALARISDLDQTAKLVQLLHGRGVVARRDLDGIETEHALARSRLTVIETGIEDQLGRINVLVANADDSARTALARGGPIPFMAPFTLDYAPVDLLRRRPDIVVAEQNLCGADARLAAARADRFPRISLGGLLGLVAGGPGALLTGGATSLRGGLGVEQVLFDGGRTGSAVDATRADRTGADAQYRKAVVVGLAEVETAWYALARARERMAHLNQAETRMIAARAAAEAAYNKGAASLIDVLTADRQLLDVREARIEADYAAADATIALFRAAGGGGWTTSPSD